MSRAPSKATPSTSRSSPRRRPRPSRPARAGNHSEALRRAAALKEGSISRAEALLRVAGHAELRVKEKSPAFVLMQYYGYLRRNPDAGGYNYWLAKLDDFNGDFIRAEMVKAFLDSVEYRTRFESR